MSNDLLPPEGVAEDVQAPKQERSRGLFGRPPKSDQPRAIGNLRRKLLLRLRILILVCASITVLLPYFVGDYESAPAAVVVLVAFAFLAFVLSVFAVLASIAFSWWRREEQVKTPYWLYLAGFVLVVVAVAVPA